MNKISKKIVALATMAAFVLTLVPAAAFAASGDVQTSTYKIADGNVEVDVNDVVETEFVINDSTGTQAGDPIANVMVWATDAQGRVTTAAVFTSDAAGSNELGRPGSPTENVYNVPSAENNGKVYVKFTRSGEYTIHAGVGNYSEVQDVTKLDELNYDENASTITVDAPGVATNYITINGQKLENGDELDITLGADDIIENGIDTATISGVAKQENDNPATGETFTISTNRDEITVDPSEVTVSNTGAFEFEYSISKAGNYKIYITNEDIEVTLNINDADTRLSTIETIENNAQVLLAGSDTKNYTGSNIPVDYSDAVQFEITDRNGDEVQNALTGSGEPAAAVSNPDHEKYLSVESKADGSDLQADDLKLVWSSAKEAYTLQYVNTGDAADDLIPGEYTVKVSLLSGDTATATFTLAEYGTTQDLVVDVTDENGVELADKVVLGSQLNASAKYADENGIEIAATGDVQFGFKGRAVYNVAGSTATLYSNDITNETFIGTVVTVQAFDADAMKYVEKELTVVESYGAYGLAFDNENGAANDENEVAVTVVDEDGKVVDVKGDLYVYIESQSNENAKIEVDALNNDKVNHGKGEISIFSNEETSVDVVVAVRANGAIYADTLTYTIGAEDPNADTTVVMTIGSTDYVVNNDIVTGDAAPYIDSAWRTMVPFRVLGETFGATVDWDQDAQTVTYTVGDTELTMTIGEETYTVNGEEQTMDTAPVLSGDRTYVPVRFVAEALGYTVTPLQDANGLTASVVFQK